MQTSFRLQSNATSCQGFTLVELMVVVALLAILATLATPSWLELLTRNRVRSAVNDFTSSLHLARSEAVRLNSAVTVCPSNDGANCTASPYHQGWIVKTGTAVNVAGQVILQDVLAKNGVRMDATAAATRNFTFLPNGRPANNFAGATLEVCAVPANMAHLTRQIVLNRSGRINLTSPNVCAI